MTLRSFLFVPGDSDKKLARGSESGADALILDLEDAVAPSRKPLARDMVRDYLAALAWDQQPRIERWLIDYAGAPDTPYVRAVSRIVLVAACRRIRKPGAKYDEMVILESPQGTDKSSGLRALACNNRRKYTKHRKRTNTWIRNS